MSRFTVVDTALAGVVAVERTRIGDARGFLSRLFSADAFAELGFVLPISQINHTLTQKAGTVRGMHFQRPPSAEDKLVTCLSGQVFDVAVDLRRGSQTYLRWHGEILSPDNQRALLIPQGCAHGFQALTDECELLYLHSRAYLPDAEGALNALDPALAIDWPLTITEISARDRAHRYIDHDFSGFPS